MPDADKSLRVMIEILTKEVGDERASVLLDDARKQGVKFGAEVPPGMDKVNIKTQELRATLRALSLQIPMIGPLLRALHSGWTFGIIGVSVAIRALTRYLDELDKKWNEMAAHAAKPLDDMRTAAEDVARVDMAHPVAGFIKALEEGARVSSASTDSFIKDVERRLEASKKELDSLKKVALAAIAAAEAQGVPKEEADARRADVEAAFSSAAAKKEEAAETEKMAEMQRQYTATAEAMAAADAKRQALEAGRDKRRQRLAQGGLPAEIASLQDQVTKATEALQKADQAAADAATKQLPMPLATQLQFGAEFVAGGGPLRERFKQAGIEIKATMDSPAQHEAYRQLLETEAVASDKRLAMVQKALKTAKDNESKLKAEEAAWEAALKAYGQLFDDMEQKGVAIAQFFQQKTEQAKSGAAVRRSEKTAGAFAAGTPAGQAALAMFGGAQDITAALAGRRNVPLAQQELLKEIMGFAGQQSVDLRTAAAMVTTIQANEHTYANFMNRLVSLIERRDRVVEGILPRIAALERK